MNLGVGAPRPRRRIEVKSLIHDEMSARLGRPHPIGDLLPARQQSATTVPSDANPGSIAASTPSSATQEQGDSVRIFNVSSLPVTDQREVVVTTQDPNPELQRDLDLAALEMYRLQGDMNQLQTELTEAMDEKEVKDLQMQLLSTSAKYNGLVARMHELDETYKAIEKRLDENTADTNNVALLQTELGRNKKETQRLQKDYTALTIQLENCKSEKRQLEKTNEYLTAQLEKCASDKKQLEADLSDQQRDWTARTQSLETQLSTTNSQLKQLSERLTTLPTDHDAASLANALGKLQTDLQKKIESIGSQQTSQSGDVARLGAALGELRGKLDTVATQQTSLASIQQNTSSLGSAIKSLTESFNSQVEQWNQSSTTDHTTGLVDTVTKALDEFQKNIQATIDPVTATVQSVADSLKTLPTGNAQQTSVDSIQQEVSSIAKTVQSLRDSFNGGTATVTKAVADFQKNIQATIDPVTATVQSVAESLKTLPTGDAKQISVESIQQGVSEIAKTVQSLSDSFNGGTATVPKALAELRTTLRDNIDELKQLLANGGVPRLADTMKQALVELQTNLQGTIDPVTATVQSVAESLKTLPTGNAQQTSVDSIQQEVSSIAKTVQSLSDSFNGGTATVPKALAELRTTLRDNIDELKQLLANGGVPRLADTMKQALVELQTNLQKTIDPLTATVQSVAESLKTLPTGDAKQISVESIQQGVSEIANAVSVSTNSLNGQIEQLKQLSTKSDMIRLADTMRTLDGKLDNIAKSNDQLAEMRTKLSETERLLHVYKESDEESAKKLRLISDRIEGIYSVLVEMRKLNSDDIVNEHGLDTPALAEKIRTELHKVCTILSSVFSDSRQSLTEATEQAVTGYRQWMSVLSFADGLKQEHLEYALGASQDNDGRAFADRLGSLVAQNTIDNIALSAILTILKKMYLAFVAKTTPLVDGYREQIKQNDDRFTAEKQAAREEFARCVASSKELQDKMLAGQQELHKLRLENDICKQQVVECNERIKEVMKSAEEQGSVASLIDTMFEAVIGRDDEDDNSSGFEVLVNQSTLKKTKTIHKEIAAAYKAVRDDDLWELSLSTLVKKLKQNYTGVANSASDIKEQFNPLADLLDQIKPPDVQKTIQQLWDETDRVRAVSLLYEHFDKRPNKNEKRNTRQGSSSQDSGGD